MKEYQFTVIKLVTIKANISVLADNEGHARRKVLAGLFDSEEEEQRVSESIEGIVSFDGCEEI